MVLDFGEVKKRLKRAIDTSADHSLLVPRNAPQLTLDATTDEISLRFDAVTGLIEHRSPTCALSLLDADTITSDRSEEHTSELQSLMRISYAVFCLKKKKKKKNHRSTATTHYNKI